MLLDRANVAGFLGAALLGRQLVHLGIQLGIVADQVGDHGMLGGELHRGGAEDGVHARGEHGDLAAGRPGGAVELEVHQRALAAADPVALHGEDFFRPAGKAVEIVEQLVGVVGDPQEPLFQLALLDGVVSCRQQQPFTTCSLASTVAHSGHQFTRLFLR